MALPSYEEYQAERAKRRSVIEEQAKAAGLVKVGGKWYKAPSEADQLSDVLNLQAKTSQIERQPLEDQKLQLEVEDKTRQKELDELDLEKKKKELSTPTAEERTLNVLDTLTGKIRGLSKKVNTKGNVAQQSWRSLMGSLQIDTDAAELNTLAEAFLSQYSRFIGGEKGTLSNQDIARVKKALPTSGDTKELAKRKLKNLDDLITSLKDVKPQQKDDVDSFLDSF